MRTTVDIPDGIYRRLKSRAARESSSTRALSLRGVKEILKTERRKWEPSCHCRLSGPSAQALWPSTMPPSTTSLFPDINVWVAHLRSTRRWQDRSVPSRHLANARATRIDLVHIEVVPGDDLARVVSAQFFEQRVFRIGSVDASWVRPVIENQQSRSCFRCQLRQLSR